jgi:phage terminase large subunit-like protein
VKFTESIEWAERVADSGDVSTVTAASLVAFANRARRGGYLQYIADQFADSLPQGIECYPYWWPVVADTICREVPCRIVSFSVPRGHGKTTLAALLAGWVMRDPERSRLVLSAATGLQQARMASDVLATIHHPADGKHSKWKAVHNNQQPGINHGQAKLRIIATHPKRADGWTPDLVLADEAARLPGDFLSRLITASAKLPHGIMLMTTTADGDVSLPWAHWRRTAEEAMVGAGLREDWAVHHWAADPGCDIRDPAQWRKANPQLLVGRGNITEETISSLVATLGDQAASIENFRTQYLNLPGGGLTQVGLDAAVLERQRWDWNLDDVRGRRAWAFVDLSLGVAHSGIADLSSVAVVVDAGEYGLLRTWSFCAGNLDQMRSERPWLYDWVQQGLVEHSGTDSIDFQGVEQRLAILRDCLQLETVGVDEVGWTRHWVTSVLIDRLGLPVESRSQAQREAAPAWATFKFLLNGRHLRYHDDPVLIHQLRNAVLWTDNNGGQRPVKGRTTQNIDAVVAAVNASRLWELRGRSQQWLAPSGIITI